MIGKRDYKTKNKAGSNRESKIESKTVNIQKLLYDGGKWKESSLSWSKDVRRLVVSLLITAGFQNNADRTRAMNGNRWESTGTSSLMITRKRCWQCGYRRMVRKGRMLHLRKKFSMFTQRGQKTNQ